MDSSRTNEDCPQGSPPPSCPPSPSHEEPDPARIARNGRLTARQRNMLRHSRCGQGQLELALRDTSPRPAADEVTPIQPPSPEQPYDPIVMAQALHDHPELLVADLQWYFHGGRPRWCHGHRSHNCRLHHELLLFLPNPPSDPPMGALQDLLPSQPPALDHFRTLLETQSNHDLTRLNIWHTHRGWTVGGPNGSPFPPGFPPPPPAGSYLGPLVPPDLITTRVLATLRRSADHAGDPVANSGAQDHGGDPPDPRDDTELLPPPRPHRPASPGPSPPCPPTARAPDGAVLRHRDR